MEKVYIRNVIEIRKILFAKRDSFVFKYMAEQKPFKKFAKIDCESLCVQAKNFEDTRTTNWIEKLVATSVSNSSNIVEETFFNCNSDHHYLVASFIRALEILTSRSKTKILNLFLDIKTTKTLNWVSSWRNPNKGTTDGSK